VPIREPVRCPSCRKPARWTGNPYRPFCSERCKLTDLGNWAAERYRVPGEKVSAETKPQGGDDEDEA